jgi:Protein of unknown function (DUF2961)
MQRFLVIIFVVLFASGCAEKKQHATQVALYQFDPNVSTRWSSSENANGVPGQGGKENDGGKGHAFDNIKAGDTHTLLDVKGTGMVTRMWITVADRSATMLRSLKFNIYWDGSPKPAVSVPFGDFFSVGLGRTAAFQNAFFVNAEGRSFQCFIPMPFKSSARITVTNESGKDLTHIFYDIDYQFEKEWNPDNLYFHSYWSRDTATVLTKDFELMPAIEGKGRYLGVNVGVNANPIYGKSWWGEGEVKIYLDTDTEYPTLNGTGTEDYIGTGWGQGAYANLYAGCLIADEQRKQWSFYRLHVPDPVYFNTKCKVALQQIGGSMKSEVIEMQKAGAKLIPVTIDEGGKLHKLYKKGQVADLEVPGLPDGWVNFYRIDDVSATAYFYLDRPENALPELQPVSYRTSRLRIE